MFPQLAQNAALEVACVPQFAQNLPPVEGAGDCVLIGAWGALIVRYTVLRFTVSNTISSSVLYLPPVEALLL
jgi:hypothetical protein